MNAFTIKINELDPLIEALQAADFVPIVHNGKTWKYAPYSRFVKLTGDETIAGIKTFSSSPIVPAPTTDMQAATKKYVDDLEAELGSAAYLAAGAANGVATLDSDGKLNGNQIPAISITEVFVVASEAEMLALSCQPGDVAKNTATGETFMLRVAPPTSLANWVELTVETDPRIPTADEKAALAGTGTPSATNKYVTQDTLAASERDTMPTGAIIMWGATSFPTGWLHCNGQAVSRVDHAALFALFGTLYGSGDGTTTFNLPDFVGASPVGAGTSNGYAVNETFVLATKYNDQIKTHGHTATSSGQSATHTHSGTTNAQTVAHTHGVAQKYRDSTEQPQNVSFRSTAYVPGGHVSADTDAGTYTTGGASSTSHSHGFTTGNASGDHTHTITVNSTGDGTTTHGKLVGIHFIIKG